MDVVETIADAFVSNVANTYFWLIWFVSYDDSNINIISSIRGHLLCPIRDMNQLVGIHQGCRSLMKEPWLTQLVGFGVVRLGCCHSEGFRPGYDFWYLFLLPMHFSAFFQVLWSILLCPRSRQCASVCWCCCYRSFFWIHMTVKFILFSSRYGPQSTSLMSWFLNTFLSVSVCWRSWWPLQKHRGRWSWGILCVKFESLHGWSRNFCTDLLPLPSRTTGASICDFYLPEWSICFCCSVFVTRSSIVHEVRWFIPCLYSWLSRWGAHQHFSCRYLFGMGTSLLVHRVENCALWLFLFLI